MPQLHHGERALGLIRRPRGIYSVRPRHRRRWARHRGSHAKEGRRDHCCAANRIAVSWGDSHCSIARSIAALCCLRSTALARSCIMLEITTAYGGPILGHTGKKAPSRSARQPRSSTLACQPTSTSFRSMSPVRLHPERAPARVRIDIHEACTGYDGEHHHGYSRENHGVLKPIEPYQVLLRATAQDLGEAR